MINNDNEGNINDKTWIILIITKTIIIATNNLVIEEKLNNNGYDSYFPNEKKYTRTITNLILSAHIR